MVCITGLQHSHVRLYFISGTIIVNLTISKYNANVFIKQTGQIIVKLALLWMCLSYDYFLYLSVQYWKIKRKLKGVPYTTGR